MAIKELIAQVKAIKPQEKEEFYRNLLEDEELREDPLDYAAMLQSEAEVGERSADCDTVVHSPTLQKAGIQSVIIIKTRDSGSSPE